MFDDLHDTIGANDGVMDYLRAPSVTVLNAVTEDGVAFLQYTHEYTIMDDERIVGMDSGMIRTDSTISNSGVNTSATR